MDCRGGKPAGSCSIYEASGCAANRAYRIIRMKANNAFHKIKALIISISATSPLPKQCIPEDYEHDFRDLHHLFSHNRCPVRPKHKYCLRKTEVPFEENRGVVRRQGYTLEAKRCSPDKKRVTPSREKGVALTENDPTAFYFRPQGLQPPPNILPGISIKTSPF